MITYSKLQIFLKKNTKIEYILLFVIFLLSIFFRQFMDPNIPYHFDPGKNIVYARAALQWFPLIPQYNPYFNLGEYYEYQVLFPYTVSFIHKISGASLVLISKWLVIVIGAALCLSVYYLSLEIFNNKTAALISAFLIATSKIQFLAYMNYYPQIMAMTIMPLSFVFLIRYFKYGKSRHLALVAIMSSLIILASYLVGFVYMMIVFLSAGIQFLKDKKKFASIMMIPLMTAALLTFFWLPIVWRYGIAQFAVTFTNTIFISTSAFTNEPWTLKDLFTLSGTSVIAIITGIITVFSVRKFKWDFARMLIAVWLILTFILMESYLIRPILWVDRYFQLFDIALLIAAGSFFTYLIEKINNIKKISFDHKGYIVLILLVYPFFGAMNVDFTFGKWGYPSDMEMLEYMKSLPTDSLVVAPPGLHSSWVSALSGMNVLGGDPSQMLGDRYLGDHESELIINSPDVNQKMEIIRKYGVNYIYISAHDPAYMVWSPHLDINGVKAFNNFIYFEITKVISDSYGYTDLIKVREDLKPKYNIEKINWNVTAAGYLISIICFIIIVMRPSK